VEVHLFINFTHQDQVKEQKEVDHLVLLNVVQLELLVIEVVQEVVELEVLVETLHLMQLVALVVMVY
tara:strand:+ start:112 stop:312 length:201 start_codon:yes stop_codon:yes gene_type:complete